MKRLALALIALTLMATPVAAQNLIAIGYQQLTSLSSATALTPVSGAREALIICTGQTIMWRDDGTNPTASIGMPLPINTPFPYIGSLARIKLIETAASASCNVSYYQ